MAIFVNLLDVDGKSRRLNLDQISEVDPLLGLAGGVQITMASGTVVDVVLRDSDGKPINKAERADILLANLRRHEIESEADRLLNVQRLIAQLRPLIVPPGGHH